MNKSGFAFVFLLLVVLSAASVVVLTPDNIDSVLGDDKNGILVKFYAPWCGHCKKIAPEYEAAAADLKAEGSKVVLAEADCDAHRVIGEQYQIQGYPTLKWFRNGKIQDYSGGRTRPEIVSWIKRNTLDQLNEVDAINPPTLPTYGLVVLFGKDNEGVYQELLKGARTIDDLVFAQASKSLIESQGLKTGTVVVYKPDGSSQLFEASDDILDKISTFAYPKYVEFSQAQFSRLSQQKEAIIFGFAPYTDEEAVATLKSYLNTAADKHSNVGFLYGDSAVFARGLSGAGASLNFLPTFVAIYNQRQLVWDEEVPLTAESLSNWIDNVFQGTAATNKKSEPLPESNDGPVVKLVYKNYDTYMNSGKPIFVKYYAPWCGHCKNMAADWIKLGETVKKVTIAEYDATANYAEVEPIEGFPTIIFYDGKGGKETYNGERSFDALLSFVNEKIQAHHDEL